MTGYVGYYIIYGMKKQQLSLAAAMRLKRLARGVLTPIKRTRSGKAFYCLQYGRKGRHVSRYVAAEEADAYREATENYRRFMDAVDAYVETASARTAEEIRKESEKRRRKEAPKAPSRSSRRGP